MREHVRAPIKNIFVLAPNLIFSSDKNVPYIQASLRKKSRD